MYPKAKETLHRYPYEPGVGGIKFSEVTSRLSDAEGDNDYDGPVKSGSGRPINLILSKISIKVTDPEDNLVEMDISCAGGSVTADLNTRNPHRYVRTGGHHPDMRAEEMLTTGLRYFVAQELDIRSFDAEWVGTTVNYNMFEAGLRKGQDKKVAASNTWTGKVLSRFGFRANEVRIDSSDELPRVLTKFVRNLD